MSDVAIKHIVFLLIGVICLLICSLIIFWEPSDAESRLWIPSLVSIGSVIFGVAVVHFLWQWLGPPRNNFCSLANKISQMGVVDIWRARIENAGNRREKYVKLIRKSKEVDLMGLNLANEIFNVDAIKKSIINAIKNNANIRILISEPDVGKSKISQQRLNEPGEQIGEEGKIVFPGLLGSAREGINDICKRLDRPKKFVDNVRLADKSVIYCMVLRFDDQMFVSNYLSSVVGNETPGIQIRKVACEGLFEKYSKEFYRAWNNGRKLSYDEREEIINR